MGMTLFMEAFVTIHMSVFVLLPLSKLISKDNSRKIFWTLFGVRIAILLFFDFFITTGIAIVDFMAVFVGAFIVTPIAMKKGVWNQKLSKQSGKEKVQTAAEAVIHAPAADETVTGRIVHAEDFDPLFAMSEEDCVEGFIKREMQRAGITEEQNLIPEDMLRRKNILNAVLAVLLFVYISLFFLSFSDENLCDRTYHPGGICIFDQPLSADKIFEKGDQIQIPGENLEYCHECEGIHGAGLQQKVKMGSHGGGCGRLTAVVQ